MDDEPENGIEQVRRGADALCERNEPLRERLLFAATQFWAAYFFYEYWPNPLRARADELLQTLLSRGKITESIASIAEDAVPDISSRLLEFFELAERLLVDSDLSRWV